MLAHFTRLAARLSQFLTTFFTRGNTTANSKQLTQLTPLMLSSEEALDLFLTHLKNNHSSESTIRNYSSDISQFLQTFPSDSLSKVLTAPNIELFARYQQQKNLKLPSIQRKVASLKQFCKWLVHQHCIADDPFSSTRHSAHPSTNIDKLDQLRSLLEQTKRLPLPPTNSSPPEPPPSSPSTTSTSQKKFFWFKGAQNSVANSWFDRYHQLSFTPYLHLSVLVIFSVLIGIFAYRQFFSDTPVDFAYPADPVSPTRTLSFQGRLTAADGNPITGATDVTFRLWDQLEDGTAGTCSGAGGEDCFYSTGSCSIDPDQDGIFSTVLGDTCGSAIPASVFSENAQIWLEIEVESETLSPRQPISSVPYALNSETLQGFPISASESATINTVLVMNEWGEIVLGENSPTLRSVSGEFVIEGESIRIQTLEGSDGDITLAPDGSGIINLLSNIIADGYLHAPGATLSSTYTDGTPLVINGTGGQIFSVANNGNMVGVGTLTGLTGLTSSGAITFSGLTDGIIKASSGVLSGGNDVDLTAEVTGLLPIANGGTNSNASPTAGAIAYGTGSAYAFTDQGSNGQCLTSNGSSAPTWEACSSGGSNWNIDEGTIQPINTTLDFLIGGTASESAKFAVLNVNSGTPTASVSAGEDGATFITADGQLQTTALQGLTIGGGDSGNLTLLGQVDLGSSNNGLRISSNGVISDLNATFVEINDDLQITGNDILGSSGETRITLNDGTDTTLVSGILSISDDLTVGGDTITASSVTTFNCSDCINFDDLSDSLSLDASTSLAFGANNFSFNLNSTGDLVIQDNGSARFTFNDSGNLDVADTVYVGLGSSAGRLVFNDAATDEIDVLNANLDMNSNLLLNIGNTGTDFTSAGGLTLADDLTVTGNDITFGNGERISNSSDGTIAFSDSSNTLFSMVDQGSYGFFRYSGKSDTGDPASCTEGDTYYNAFDDTLNVCTGSNTWEVLNSGTTAWDDILDPDADTTIDLSTYTTTFEFDGTTTTGWTYNADSLTSGTGHLMSFDALTSGNGLFIESAGSARVMSGDLFKVNLGASITATGNLLVVQDNTSDLFSVKTSNITSALPHEFTAAGDVSIAYDLHLTNQTASWISSSGPLTIEAGEAFENNDLTVKTYGTGDVVFDNDGTPTAIINDDGTLYVGAFSSTGTAALCWDNSGGSTINDCSGSPVADYAEIYPTEDDVEYGEIVAVGSNTTTIELVETDDFGNPLPATTRTVPKLTKASQQSANYIGITSRNWSDFSSTGHNVVSEDDHPMPVALAGRVPVKISASSTSIQPGDLIGLSAEPGKAQKVNSGFVIGRALESWQAHSGKASILVLVTQFHQTNADSFLTADGQLQLPNDALIEGELIVKGTNIFAQMSQIIANFNQINQTINQLQNSFSQFASLTTDWLKTKTLIVEQQLVSPVVETDQLTTNLISPLAENDLEILLSPTTATQSGNALVIKNSQTEQTVATINSSGDATFSGSITSRSSRTEQLEANFAQLDQLAIQDATVSGQLYLNNGKTIDQVLADNQQYLASLSAQSENNNSTNSFDQFMAQLTGVNNASLSATLETLQSEQNLQFSDNDVVLSAEAIFIHEYLGVNGFAQITAGNVQQSLTVGQSLIFIEDSISTINDSLFIQPTGSGKLDLMASLMVLDEDGSVTINGDLNVAGNLTVEDSLSANLLQPNDFSSDFVLKLASDSADLLSETTNSQLTILGASDSAVASIDASGSARFQSLTTQGVVISQPSSQAEDEVAQLIETEKNSTVGNKILPALQTELVIQNNNVKANALIYLTPTSDTQNQVLYVKEKQLCRPEDNMPNCQPSFTVAIKQAVNQPIEFNYWIVQVTQP